MLTGSNVINATGDDVPSSGTANDSRRKCSPNALPGAAYRYMERNGGTPSTPIQWVELPGTYVNDRKPFPLSICRIHEVTWLATSSYPNVPETLAPAWVLAPCSTQ